MSIQETEQDELCQKIDALLGALLEGERTVEELRREAQRTTIFFLLPSNVGHLLELFEKNGWVKEISKKYAITEKGVMFLSEIRSERRKEPRDLFVKEERYA